MSTTATVSPSSMICNNFAENAWKKDLCSNCFKSEVEHIEWLSSATGAVAAPAGDAQQQQKTTNHLNINENMKSEAKPQNMLTNQSSIRPLNTNNKNFSHNSTARLNNINNTNEKSINDCQNTNKALIISDKKSTNSYLCKTNTNSIKSNNKNIYSSKIVTNNTIQHNINSIHVSTNNSQTMNAMNNNISESQTHYKNSNNCNDLRKTTINMNDTNSSEVKESMNNTNVEKRALLLNGDQKFPQLKDTKHLLSKNNLKNTTNNTPVITTCAVNTMPLIGILKTNTDVIEYRSKKCLVFKEGDPLVIEGVVYVDDDYDSDGDEEVDRDSDEEYDDPMLYTSDDKQLRELTQNNTKFNSNAKNFSINITNDNKNVNQVIDSKESVRNCDKTSDKNKKFVSTGGEEQTIPEVCEKLVENGFKETFGVIDNCMNQMNICEDVSQTPDSAGSDVTPMSTSSDSYSSSGDEKEDLQTIEIQDLKNSFNSQNIGSNHLRTDSESDNSSTISDSSLESKDSRYRPQLPTKPQLPVKPKLISNLKSFILTLNSETICESQQKLFDNSIEKQENNSIPVEEVVEECKPQLVEDNVYQEINESDEDMNGMIGKFSTNFDNHLVTEMPSEADVRPNDKREMKLAELAQELEQCRHMKRPAPKPPSRQHSAEEVLEIDVKKSVEVRQQKPLTSTMSNPLPGSPSKPRFSSIRKLLHKKSSSDKSLSDKSTNGMESSVVITDRKAWKQTEFDRTNIQIVHPIDLVVINGHKTDDSEQRPSAPPRTPKANRPSVPARRRKSSPNAMTPKDPPPQHVTEAVKNSLPMAPVVETTVVDNDLNKAYNQLAKSNHSNLLAIKSKIESTYSGQSYNWPDFEVTKALKLGSVLVYKDCIESKTRKSVNLLVLSECYSAPIVIKFRHHSELVVLLDHKWTQYHLISELNECHFNEKQMNSLILQLYTILEDFEHRGYNRLAGNTINTVIVCASREDILLIVPQISATPVADRNESTDSTEDTITVHQFLSQVLALLLPNTLFASVGHVLSQPSVPISHSKTIVQLIAFRIPVQQMTATDADCELHMNYWFDINGSKFINQFCCLNDTNLLTQLDFIYLKFLCNQCIDLIQNSIKLMINCKQ